jgi:Immunity protein 21
MNWVKSGGGPLLCAPIDLSVLWQGTNANSELGHAAKVTSDYERACQIRDYVGAIDIQGRRALVLGDMPLEIAVFSDDCFSVTIVRLMFIDPGIDAFHLARGVNDSLFLSPMEKLDFHTTSGEMVIFDSAIPGRGAKDGGIFFTIRPGGYTILTVAVEPNTRTSMILHRFISKK